MFYLSKESISRHTEIESLGLTFLPEEKDALSFDPKSLFGKGTWLAVSDGAERQTPICTAANSSTSTETEDEPILTRAGNGSVNRLELTVLAHPDLSRIGERRTFRAQPDGLEVLSRNKPDFAQPRGGRERPLGHKRLSRKPIYLRQDEEGGITIDSREWRSSVLVDGAECTTEHRCSSAEIERGVLLLLARRVLLLLHRHGESIDQTDGFGLVGESEKLVRARNQIRAIANTDFSVLILGETGTGKELIARAIADQDSRRKGELVSLNMAALPASLAAAELFGARAGAYSGQQGALKGAFREADGGTLFLDEIGETPLEVQAMLLRALETREIQPLGGSSSVPVDLRILAATDSDLQRAVDIESFRSPLLHRLGGYQIRLPPLRRRREDLGRLIVHFLRQEMEELGQLERLATPEFKWLPAEWVQRLALYRWPGNIRELKNVVRRWVVALVEADWNPNLSSLIAEVEEDLENSGSGPEPENETPESTTAPLPKSARIEQPKFPSMIDRPELIDGLERGNWDIKRTALLLGISRASMYPLMRRHGLKAATDLDRDSILESRARHGSDLVAMARELGTSLRGLIAQMTRLQIDQDDED